MSTSVSVSRSKNPASLQNQPIPIRNRAATLKPVASTIALKSVAPSLPRALVKTSLYYCEGNSDKEYHAEIVAVAGGHHVNFRYGRRGGTLTTGCKTAAPVEFAEAKQIYDKLVKEKTAKGYVSASTVTKNSSQSPSYQSADESGLKTGFMPQLLNPISEAEAMRLIEHPDWSAQEKMDGERRAAHADCHSVIGINRRGLQVPLPLTIASELQATIPANHEIPCLNALIDVEYLYAYRGGSIYQPVYRGQRTDLELSACTLSQLKFKPEGRVGHGI